MFVDYGLVNVDVGPFYVDVDPFYVNFSLSDVDFMTCYVNFTSILVNFTSILRRFWSILRRFGQFSDKKWPKYGRNFVQSGRRRAHPIKQDVTDISMCFLEPKDALNMQFWASFEFEILAKIWPKTVRQNRALYDVPRLFREGSACRTFTVGSAVKS